MCSGRRIGCLPLAAHWTSTHTGWAVPLSETGWGPVSWTGVCNRCFHQDCCWTLAGMETSSRWNINCIKDNVKISFSLSCKVRFSVISDHEKKKVNRRYVPEDTTRTSRRNGMSWDRLYDNLQISGTANKRRINKLLCIPNTEGLIIPSKSQLKEILTKRMSCRSSQRRTSGPSSVSAL